MILAHHIYSFLTFFSDLLISCTEQSISVEKNTGPSTLDKRNRKKRAAKEVSPDLPMSKKWKVDPDIDSFYTKYLRNKYFNPKKP